MAATGPVPVVRLRVDADKCIGAGLCEAVAEEIFTLGPRGVSEPVSDHVLNELLAASPDHRADLDEAIHVCPVQAIVAREAKQ